MNDKNRSRTRVNYSAHALVESKGKGTVGGTIRDISLETVYLYILPVFEIDEEVTLKIILLGEDSQLTIKVSAKVFRKDRDGAVLRFLKPLEWWPIFAVFPLKNLANDNNPPDIVLE